MVRRHQVIDDSQFYLFSGANPQDAGIINRKGFHVVDWSKGIRVRDSVSPYDANDISFYKAETFQGEITTEPMTVYRRMDWKQYYDGLEMGYLHPMRTRMDLRPDEKIGGIGQPEIWVAKNPNIYSGLSHLSGKTAKQLFEIDIPIGTRIKGGYDIQILDSIPIENVRPFYLGDEEEYTHMAETKPSKIKRCKTCLKEGHNASQCVSENVPFSKAGFWVEYNMRHRPIPDPDGKRTYKSLYGDGKTYQDYEQPKKFGYQESELHFNEVGTPYRVKTKWGEDDPYAIAEYANFGYANEGYNAGIMKSKENAPIVLSESLRVLPFEAYSSKTTEHETTSWGDLKKRLKGKSVGIGDMEYSVSNLKDAFKYLPPETILRIRLIDGSILIITFVYDDEGWDFMLAPLVDTEGNTHMAETKPPKTSKGLIVYPNRMAELIRDGDKQMIVKDKPLDIAGKRYTVVTNRKGYAYIQLGAMQMLTLPKFKALKDKHLITPEERVKYFKGKRRLYAWPVKVLREFDKPYPTNAPLRPQDIAPKLKTYASEEMDAEKEVVY